MNMFKVVLGILIFGCYGLHAQPVADSDSLKNHDGYIIYLKTYKKGIYKTFEEFKYNQPSITDNYTFDGKNILMADRKTGKTRKVDKSQIWGFSDGTRIYAAWKKYDEVIEKGRYCYFKEKGIRVAMAVSHLMFLPIPMPYKREFIVNYNTGKTYVLSKKLLKKILASDDPALLKDYERESRKKKKLFAYVVKYNARNGSKVK